MVKDSVTQELRTLRAEIDQADRALLEAIQRRFLGVAKIGDLKKRSHLPVIQKDRWEEVIRQRQEWASELGLSAEWVQRLMDLIHQEAVRLQS